MTVTYHEDDATRIAEITVSGKLTSEDFAAVSEPLAEFIDRHGTIRFLEIVQKFGGFDPSVLWPGVRYDFRVLPHISHVAVVSDIGWISPIVQAAAKVVPLKMRMFDLAEEAAAREWLRTAD